MLMASMLVSLSVQAAPAAPDSGQSLRELEQQPVVEMPKEASPVNIQGDDLGGPLTADGAGIEVKAVRVSGSTVFSSSELEALIGDLTGGEHSLSDIRNAAARITAYYRQRGYTLARAYLPAQEIKSGRVEIAVLEGRIDKKEVINNSRLMNAGEYFNDIKPGDGLNQITIERALLLLNDTPGVSDARATVQPGASVGTSDLLLELNSSAPWSGNVELDNHGNRYTGNNRLSGLLRFNSPLGIGDQFFVRALSSDEALTYARLAYQLPFGVSGIKAGAAYSETNYRRLAKEFVSLRAHGSAQNISAFATYPFIRSLENSVFGTLSWEAKDLADYTDTPATASTKKIKVASLGVAGSHQDMQTGRRATTFEITLAAGRLDMDPVTLNLDNSSARSNGRYSRLSYSVVHQERMTNADSLMLALSGQRTNKNLNSSEKFSLGGANGVRAYPQGEGVGDQGWLTSIEVRHMFSQEWQGLLFYDAGSVTINRNPFVSGVANSRSISGAGIGANASYFGMQFKAFLAWRTGGGFPNSEPASQAHGPRMWVQVAKQF